MPFGEQRWRQQLYRAEPARAPASRACTTCLPCPWLADRLPYIVPPVSLVLNHRRRLEWNHMYACCGVFACWDC